MGDSRFASAKMIYVQPYVSNCILHLIYPNAKSSKQRGNSERAGDSRFASGKSTLTLLTPRSTPCVWGLGAPWRRRRRLRQPPQQLVRRAKSASRRCCGRKTASSVVRFSTRLPAVPRLDPVSDGKNSSRSLVPGCAAVDRGRGMICSSAHAPFALASGVRHRRASARSNARGGDGSQTAHQIRLGARAAHGWCSRGRKLDKQEAP